MEIIGKKLDREEGENMGRLGRKKTEKKFISV